MSVPSARLRLAELCIDELYLSGREGAAREGGKTLEPGITASIGTIGKNDKTGPAVQSLKLLAQATGEYTREELNKDGKLGWTDKTAMSPFLWV